MHIHASRLCVGGTGHPSQLHKRSITRTNARTQTTLRYVSETRAAPGCRTGALRADAAAAVVLDGNGGDDDAAAASSGGGGGAATHQRLLHRFQSLDPDDPWLQWEWGAALLASGGARRAREAALHFRVAAAVFARHHERLARAAAGGGADSGGDDDSGGGGGALSSAAALEDLAGARLGARAALGLAAAVARDFVDLLPAAAPAAAAAAATTAEGVSGDGSGSGSGGAGGGDDLERLRCEGMLQECHLQLRRVLALQQGEGEGQGDAVAEAKRDARRCIQRIRSEAACAAEAAELGKLLLGQQREEEEEGESE